MQTITRQLSNEEFTAWDKVVASSPQASLFHTIAWNQMLHETASDRQEWVQLIYERQGVFLGGIALHYLYSGLKAQATLPMFGYNGPILSDNMHYQEPYKTIPSYEIILELLKNINSILDDIVIKNQPEIWDVRAYAYNDWKIGTCYTHVLPCQSPSDVWEKMDMALKEQINTSQYKISADITNAQIQKFSLYASKDSGYTRTYQETQLAVLRNRIYWMKEKELCKLVTITDKYGKELAIAFFILSKGNRTIYLWKTIPLIKGMESDILPSLIWQSYLSFGIGFEHMDLGSSTNMAISFVKDQLGCNLTPTYIAKYPKF